jgi:hypothetical protein
MNNNTNTTLTVDGLPATIDEFGNTLIDYSSIVHPMILYVSPSVEQPGKTVIRVEYPGYQSKVILSSKSYKV